VPMPNDTAKLSIETLSAKSSKAGKFIQSLRALRVCVHGLMPQNERGRHGRTL
jgi:hypothetical protein